MGRSKPDSVNDGAIAIVGMSVHVPGATTLDAYWRNLRDGVESIRPLDEAALLAAGENPETIRRANYVRAGAPLDGYDQFDPDFFGFSPKEAAILDPQHRKFLEVSWEALEAAGHPPESFGGTIGVYAGCGMGSYFYFNICSNPGLVDDVGMFLLRHTGNDKDFLSTRVSHVFDLKGPSVNLQTACSTSLVAVHYASQALRQGDCDMAIAGGVTIELPQGRGYLYQENEILSPDGHCHAFDHRAQGTVFGSGAGAVVLRRLKDAVEDGDHIWAVIRGSAVNNDGADKAGYLAPSVSGQAAAVAMAHRAAGVDADTVGYVECHGTGTYLGDPIEVSALTEAFRRTTDKTRFCRIGSVKTNIGHLDTAAGVASLAKAALAVHHAEIPPSLGFEKPNPVIEFETGPFRVADSLTPWQAAGPRRAGVNSLGVGGTNAHVVLEQAPDPAPSDDSDWPFQILTVSARSKAALEANTDVLAAHLAAHPGQPLADVAFTLKEGRRAFAQRRVVVAESHAEAAELLRSRDPYRVLTHSFVGEAPEVVFLFPGGGAQYPGMARDLYETEPVFREWMDRGLAHLEPQLDYDIRALWLGDGPGAAERLKRPSVQLPLIMITEYALAQLWLSWGVTPAALIGHSMGENTAACLAGVMRFEECIDLVLLRGRLFDRVPPGGMLSVPLAETALAPYMDGDLDIAAVNAADLTAVSGPQSALDTLQARLAADGIEAQRIAIDIAAHSRMLEPILDEFRAFLDKLDLRPPLLAFVSNRTGEFITAAQATDPGYWVEHLRHTVRFADCVDRLAHDVPRVWLEVGPGRALSTLAQAHPAVSANQVLSSLRHPDQEIADDLYFVGAIGRLWAMGIEADWSQIWGEARRRRVPLPTYQFQRARYFIEPGTARAEPETAPLVRRDAMESWGYRPVWRRALAPEAPDEGDASPEAGCILVFADTTGLASAVSQDLRDAGHRVIEVAQGDTFARRGPDAFVLAPEDGRAGYDALVAALTAEAALPARIAHFWLVTGAEEHRPGSSFFDRNQEAGFYSLTHLAQALGEADAAAGIHMTVVTNGAARVADEALPYPEKAMIAGPCGVLPREFPGLTCATLDIERPQRAATGGLWRRRVSADVATAGLVSRLRDDILAEPGNRVAAFRGTDRFELRYRATDLSAVPDAAPVFRTGGTYLITGGLGGIGLTMAERLIRDYRANVVLVSRQGLPERDDWAAHVLRHGPADRTARRIREIQRLESLGGAVMTAAADVSNPEEMAAAVADARARFGPIHAVLHASGVLDDAPALAKSRSDIEAVLAPKVQGTRVLDALFPDGTLELMVLFSSTSTATRPAGQIDYVAANEFLNAFAASRAGGRTRVVSVNWGVWSEIGMAADAAGTAPHPDLRPEPVSGPLLDTARHDALGRRVFETRLSVSDHWIVDEHRTAAGDALLPGTGYLELAAQALAAQGEQGPFEVSDLHFLRPLAVQDSAACTVRTRLRPTVSGYDFEVLSRCETTGRPGFVLNARASLATGKPVAPPQRLDLDALSRRTRPKDGAAPLASPQAAHLAFGPRWRVLRAMRLGRQEGLAHLALPVAARGDLRDGYLLHPALMDLATGWALELAPGYDGRSLWVPAGYRRVAVRRPVAAEVFSWVRLASDGTDDGIAEFDITICDPDGEVLVEVEGFTMTRLADGVAFARTADTQTAEGIVDAETTAPPPVTAAQERLAYLVSQGIRPQEGPEALIRAVATDQPQIVVSSIDLPALVNQANASLDTGPAHVFDRPESDADFVAPSTGIEKTLAGLWQDLLGVSRVGAHDSFFDLGGHSLIAVRLFSKIRATFGADFPISTLFEAPSVTALAALIGERTGIAEDGDAPAAPAALRPRHTHLVAMHEGKGGSGAPMYMVAGMFGNVLNLRHLAQLTGADRPFYGLQARGLLGDTPPHGTIPAAARDYIAEMREVQPHGPYLLGGFSGGGIAALEMARQLEAAGEEVAMLVLLDTPLPVRPALTSRDKALIKFAELHRKGPSYAAEWLRNRWRWEIAKRRRAAGTEDAPDQFHDLAIEAAFRRAVAEYRLQPWNGPVTLFRPPLDRHWKVSQGRWVGREREYVLPDNDWGGWLRRLVVQEVPGNHDSMVLEPNVRVLAQRLRACLDAAERGTETTEAPGWVPAAAAE